MHSVWLGPAALLRQRLRQRLRQGLGALVCVVLFHWLLNRVGS